MNVSWLFDGLLFNYSNVGWRLGCKLFPEEIVRAGPVFEGNDKFNNEQKLCVLDIYYLR